MNSRDSEVKSKLLEVVGSTGSMIGSTGPNSGGSSTIVEYMGDRRLLTAAPNREDTGEQHPPRQPSPAPSDPPQPKVIGTVFHCQMAPPVLSPAQNDNSTQCLQAVSKLIAAHGKEPEVPLSSKRRRHLKFDLDADDDSDSCPARRRLLLTLRRQVILRHRSQRQTPTRIKYTPMADKQLKMNDGKEYQKALKTIEGLSVLLYPSINP